MSHEIQFRVMVVTPEQAAEWMKLNPFNRPEKPSRVESYADTMTRGEWMLNGEALIFAGNFERLLNGQHRLQAIIKSGVTIQICVIWNVRTDCFATMDTGAPRFANDALSIQGEEDGTTLAAALSAQHFLRQGMSTQPRRKLTIPQIQGMLCEHPQIRRSVRMFARRRRGLIPPGLSSALHYLFSEKDPARADAFFSDLQTGEGLLSNDAVYWLRARLIDNLSAKAKLRGDYIAALAIKAWNARIAGTPVANLRHHNTDKFPAIEGGAA